MKKSFLSVFAASALSLGSIQLLVPKAVFAQQLSINPSNLCGTWQAIPGSGDFIHGEIGHPERKVEGTVHGTIKYNIYAAGKRILRATQSVTYDTHLDKNGKWMSSGNITHGTALERLDGVTQGDSIYFVDANQPFTERWLQLPGNKFDVIGLRSGKADGAIHFIVEQTTRAVCK